ncbi:hypothetical protein FXO37_02266 [Capsicum annuum]|nr:hypothetical protein FXO37_02266 [Capsicum annuum]
MVEYEGPGILCVGCGIIGHNLRTCSFTPSPQTLPNASSSATPPQAEIKTDTKWKLVNFPKRKSEGSKPSNQVHITEARTSKNSHHNNSIRNTTNRSRILSLMSMRLKNPSLVLKGAKLKAVDGALEKKAPPY